MMEILVELIKGEGVAFFAIISFIDSKGASNLMLFQFLK